MQVAQFHPLIHPAMRRLDQNVYLSELKHQPSSQSTNQSINQSTSQPSSQSRSSATDNYQSINQSNSQTSVETVRRDDSGLFQLQEAAAQQTLLAINRSISQSVKQSTKSSFKHSKSSKRKSKKSSNRSVTQETTSGGSGAESDQSSGHRIKRPSKSSSKSSKKPSSKSSKSSSKHSKKRKHKNSSSDSDEEPKKKRKSHSTSHQSINQPDLYSNSQSSHSSTSTVEQATNQSPYQSNSQPNSPSSARSNSQSLASQSNKESNKQSVQRGTKGLRHFSILLCLKLAEIGQSTYPTIADMLIADAKQEHDVKVKAGVEQSTNQAKGYDDKNIRRRIYDALNVLISIGLIEKTDKKAINWLGPPMDKLLVQIRPDKNMEQSIRQTINQPVVQPQGVAFDRWRSEEPARKAQLEAKLKEVQQSITRKRMILTDEVLQYVGMRHLLERNQSANDEMNDQSSDESTSHSTNQGEPSPERSTNQSTNQSSEPKVKLEPHVRSNNSSANPTSNQSTNQSAVPGESSVVPSTSTPTTDESPTDISTIKSDENPAGESTEGFTNPLTSQSINQSINDDGQSRLHFPFILMNTSTDTSIDCSISADRSSLSFSYSDVFSVHDHSVIVRMIGKSLPLMWDAIPKQAKAFVVGLERQQAECERLKALDRSISQSVDQSSTDQATYESVHSTNQSTSHLTESDEDGESSGEEDSEEDSVDENETESINSDDDARLMDQDTSVDSHAEVLRQSTNQSIHHSHTPVRPWAINSYLQQPIVPTFNPSINQSINQSFSAPFTPLKPVPEQSSTRSASKLQQSTPLQRFSSPSLSLDSPSLFKSPFQPFHASSLSHYNSINQSISQSTNLQTPQLKFGSSPLSTPRYQIPPLATPGSTRHNIPHSTARLFSSGT